MFIFGHAELREKQRIREMKLITLNCCWFLLRYAKD
jgi:hypothetical protein